MFYVYVQNKLVITTDTKDIAKKIAIQHGFTNFEITETKKADDNANENGYFLELVKNGFKICEPKPKEKSLSELKSEKLSELTTLCHNFDDKLVNNDMYIISSLGFKINADIRSQNNLKGLISVNADTVNFIDYNNEIHKLTQKDLNTLLIECSKNGENLYIQKWTYAKKIKACKTIKELEKITFDFVMLDFSEVTDEVSA